MRTLFTNCTILTGPGAALIEPGFLLVDGPIIAAVGPMSSAPPAAPDLRLIDGRGKLLMPGLINGHNHAAMTLFRGLADDLNLSDWLHQHIFPAEAAHANREMVYWSTKLACAEMLLSGTTCVADAYFFSNESARAFQDCGMRAIVGHGVVDFPAPSVPDPSKNIETVAGFIQQWQGGDPRVQPAVFAHAPYTCGPTTLTRAKALADRCGVRFFIHLAESRNEMATIIDPRGSTPLGHLAALDLLDANTVLIHGVWLDHADLDILAASGAQIITCPQSNLKLASGIAPVAAMLHHHIPVGLGTDGCASNNSLDMFREMDLLAKIHKVCNLEATQLPAAAVLTAATTANATILGLADVGRLAPGYRADLILLDLQTPRLTPFYNADLLVYAASGADVETVMVDGRLVVDQRRIVSFDLAETVERVRAMAESIRQQRAVSRG